MTPSDFPAPAPPETERRDPNNPVHTLGEAGWQRVLAMLRTLDLTPEELRTVFLAASELLSDPPGRRDGAAAERLRAQCRGERASVLVVNWYTVATLLELRYHAQQANDRQPV